MKSRTPILPASDPIERPDAEPRVRESARARKVLLRMSPREGLEVVVPRGFDKALVPGILESHRGWIERMRHRLEIERSDLPTGYFDATPGTIHLHALGKQFEVLYRKSAARGTRVRAFPERLLVEGPEGDASGTKTALRRWLLATAKRHLPDQLAEAAAGTGLGYMRCSVRSQKTRWGSCSSQGSISLNCKLLFLPADVVRYVLVHELCHTRYLNHSADFWALVKQKEPDYQHLDRQLRSAWRLVPQWAEG